MTKLIATRDFKYRTRRLMAGDTFDARNDLEVTILTRVRRVAEVPPDKPLRAKRPQLDHDNNGREGGSVTAAGDDLSALRAEYFDKLGKRPFNGWDADTLREKIADAD